jgi:hypothetical protein
MRISEKEDEMKDFRTYKGWEIERGISAPLPQGYHQEIYANTRTRRIYLSDLLSQNWWTEPHDPDDHKIGGKYRGSWDRKTTYPSRDELITAAEAALRASREGKSPYGAQSIKQKGCIKNECRAME